MRELDLAKETVRRFYRATSADELLAKTRDRRPSILDDYKPYLHQRWNQGCTNVWQLHAEIRGRGYRGGYGTVRDYLQPFRALAAAPPATPVPPKVRDVTSWLLRDPDSLHEDDKLKLKQIQDRCPHLDALAGHVTEFAKILTGRHGDRLAAWIAAVEADDQPDLHSFTTGLKRDYDAVLNGLTLPWSSGAVEGNVNRLQMLKRQMYGRAGFALLRRRPPVLTALSEGSRSSRNMGQIQIQYSGSVTGKVEPHRDLASPVDRARVREIDGGEVGIKLLTRPPEQVGHQARAQNPGAVDPPLITLSKPADELLIIRRNCNDPGLVVIPIPGEPAEVHIEQVQGDVLHRPSRCHELRSTAHRSAR